MKVLTGAIALSLSGAALAQTNIIGDHTTTKTPSSFVGPQSNLGNGDFETDATTGTRTFAQISNWFNLAGAETVNFGRSDGTAGSPQSGSLGAQLSGTTFVANNTSYTITAANQAFSANMYLGQFGNAALYGLDTTVTVSLFTSTTGVTDTTVLGDITVLGTLVMNPFHPTTATFNMNGGTVHTTTAADIGKVVYMGINLTDTGNDAFPRLDVVSLSVATVVPTPSLVANHPETIGVVSPATTATKTFTIQNQGASSITVNSFSGLAATGFTILSPATPFSIPAAGNQVVTVQWNSATASSTVLESATLAINSTDAVSPTIKVPLNAGIATAHTGVLPNGNFETAGTDNVTWADTFATWNEFDDGANSLSTEVRNVPGLIAPGTAALLNGKATSVIGKGAIIRGNLSQSLTNFEVTADFAVSGPATGPGSGERSFNIIVTSQASAFENVNIRYQSGQFAARDLDNDWKTVIPLADLNAGAGLTPSVDGDANGSLNDAGDTKVAYKLKLTGSGWGTPNPFMVLEIFDASNVSIAKSAQFRYWRNAAPTLGDAQIDQVEFNSAYSTNSPANWVDEVSVSGFALNTTTPPPGGFATWSTANAGGQDPDGDFDLDGVSNGVEYFMNAAAGFTANPGLNASNTVTWTNGGNIPDTAYGSQFVVQTSTDLVIWTNVDSGNPNLANSAGSVSFTVTGSGKQFVRLRVVPD